MTRPPTAFQTRVYNATCRIPEGKVTTYRLLGEAIGCNSARAIGQALRRNPFAPEVPCHRIIASDRKIGGFYGETEGPEIQKKRQLLESEGIRFGDDDRIDSENLVALEPSLDDELSLVIG